MLRAALLRASESGWLRERATRWGFARRAVRRFLPGERLEDALAAADALAREGIPAVLTELGENVATAAAAASTVEHYRGALERIAERGLRAEVSVKPTHLGLDQDAGLALAHVRELARAAAVRPAGADVLWIDMEGSAYTEATLALYAAARRDHANVGVCLQAYLYRSADDLESLLAAGAAVRLVKGAYAEPPELAYPAKREVDENYLRLARRLLAAMAAGRPVRAAFATHDGRLIDRLVVEAAERGVPRERLEFQMLYGIRRDEQRRLAAAGHDLRVLISYGAAWYPWYMRRLAERPANLLFVLRSLGG